MEKEVTKQAEQNIIQIAINLELAKPGKQRSVTKPIWSRISHYNPTYLAGVDSKEKFLACVRQLFATCSTFTWLGKTKNITTGTPFALDFACAQPTLNEADFGDITSETSSLENDEETDVETEDSSSDGDLSNDASENEDEPTFRRRRRVMAPRRDNSIYDYYND